MAIETIINHMHLFCGIGGGAKGFNKGQAKVGNLQAKFVCIGGIDVDAAACRDFKSITGVPATRLDMFSREQYIDFHGKEPPADWREATVDDIRAAGGNKHPHIAFLSAPCKGFSGLLSEKMSGLAKYQALNGLTLRGLFLLLEAHKDNPVELIVFENVPRIATRGRFLLDQIVGLLHGYGYAAAETTHDCGEIGHLGQSRKRFLLVARHIAKVPPFLYEPVKHPLRGVGEILERLPIPGLEPGLGGPMHRMPSLQWKTWVRLAFVRAGADWRSLNDLRIADGHLTDFGIMPEGYGHRGTLGVRTWEEPSGGITGQAHATRGAFNVADPREVRIQDFHGLRVNEWGQHAGPITTQRSPGSSAQSVADPRIDGHEKSVQMGVGHWEQPASVVKGDVSVGTGRYAVADPRLEGKRFNTTFRIVQWGKTSPAVAGPGGPAGGLSVADPRSTGPREGAGKYKVAPFDGPAGAVISGSTTGQGAFALADPRFDWHEGASSSKMRVTEWEGSSRTITGAQQLGSGAGAVADPRYAVPDPRSGLLKDGATERATYQTGGHYGVIGWNDHSGAVPGFAKQDRGPWSVADPRPESLISGPSNEGEEINAGLPGANQKLICVIRALDGTWHRPFTTLELAALQGLVDPEEDLILDGLSDSAWRERIGNMVPPPAATAVAGVMGVTLLAAWSGQTFMMGSTPIWVRNVAVALMAAREE